MTKPMTVEEVLNQINDLRAVVSTMLLPSSLPPILIPREYSIGKVGDTQEVYKNDEGIEKVRSVSHVVGEVHKAGELWDYTFGIDYAVEGSGIKGLPETIEHRFGIDRHFLVNSLVLTDECAEFFDIEGLFIGAKSMWYPGLRVPGTRFAKSAPAVDFATPIFEGGSVTVRAINKSSESRVFNAVIVGKEREKSEATK